MKKAHLSQYLLDIIYPIGSLYFTVVDDTAQKVQNRFGGNWELFGAGRTPVCVDTNDSDFNTVEKTGGSKYLQKHQHTEYVNSGSGGRYPYTLSNGGGPSTTGNFFQNNSIFGNFTGPQVLTGESGTGNSGNLQPYKTCYIWKRVAD